MKKNCCAENIQNFFRAVILVGWTCVAACGSAVNFEPDPSQASFPSADQMIRDFALDAIVAGKKEWTLHSPRADYFEEGQRVDVQKPVVQFFEDERPSSRLEAGRGQVHTDTQDLWAWDDLVIVSTDGARLTSDWMHYVSERDRIVSTAPVTIVRQNSIVNGLGWEASPDLSEMVIHRQIVEIDNRERGGRPR